MGDRPEALATEKEKGPWVGNVVVEDLTAEGKESLYPELKAVGPETPAGTFKKKLITYRVRSIYPVGAKIVVDVYSIPGASIEDISKTLRAQETASSHHDIVIFQGGKNNALGGGANTAWVVSNYKSVIIGVLNHTKALGVPLYVDNLTPIIPEVLTQRGFNGPQYQTNIEAINAAQIDLDILEGIEIIYFYDLFKAHYSLEESAWCRNLANLGDLDGSHLSQYGTRELGREYWEAICPYVLEHKDYLPLSVAIYGDSITACTYLGGAKRPASWMVYYSSLNQVSDWRQYQ